MKQLLASALFSLGLVLVGCSSSSSPVGTYTVDVDSMAKMAADDSKGKVTLDDAKKMMASMKIELELKADNTFIVNMTMPMGMGSQKSEGTWKMDGGDVAFTTVTEDGKKKAAPETKKASFKGGMLTMEDKGQKITMKKK